MKKIIVFLFVLVLLSSLVEAVKPSVASSGTEMGYLIEYPLFDYIEQGSTMKFNFHLYNSTSGYPVNNASGVKCYFHLYNSTGKHVLVLNDLTITDHNYDYQANIDGSYISNIGTYSYSMQCNNSNQGGFVESGFNVVKGAKNNQNDGYFGIGFIFLLLVMMSFFGFMGYMFSKEENYTYFMSYLFWYIALFFPLYGMRVLRSMVFISPYLVNLVNGLYRVYLVLYAILFVFFIAYLLILMLSWLIYQKKPPYWKKYQERRSMDNPF